MRRDRTLESLPKLLRHLWEEGFFSSGRTSKEISEALASQGFHTSSSNLSVALIRLVKKGLLVRKRKDRGWRYLQKYPVKSPQGKRTSLFSQYELHDKIKEVSFKQFQDGHYKEAIQNALVEVIDQVKIKSGRPKKTKNSKTYELDGDELMNHVFGCDNQVPIIKFNALKDNLDKAEQRGLMYLFKGVVGVRNKKAHLNFVQNDPLKTIEYLSLASLLLRLLDEYAP